MTFRQSLLRHSKLVFASAIVAASFLMQPVAIHAQTAAPKPAAAADAGTQPWYGILNDDNVYVRSGPSDERYYATAKLNKGAKITVVSGKDDWLKIIPPEGSFCYVAKAYVEKRGDGTVGRVTKPDLNVRAGSLLNSLKTTVQTSLEEGDDVKIVGEETEYFKISPPPGAYLYVKKTFVDPAPQLASNTQPPTVAAPAGEQHLSYPIASDPIPTVIAPAGAAPATQPAGVVAAAAPATQPAIEVAVAPTTKPVEPSPDEKFGALENAFLDATNLPLDQQPIDSLVTQYAQLSTDPALPLSMRRIADRRLATLKVRATAKKDFLDAQKMKADFIEKRNAQTAENDELQAKLKQNAISVYSAVGTLRISSLQQSGTTLYRLTDPGTGHTLVYIRSNDPKYTEMLNKFVGVNGDITEDTGLSLKVIAPTTTEVVDPSKVNTNVTATIIPPSMLAKTATATLAGN